MLNFDLNQLVYHMYMWVLECSTFNYPVQLDTLPMELSPVIETPSPLQQKEGLTETPEKIEKASFTKHVKNMLMIFLCYQKKP